MFRNEPHSQRTSEATYKNIEESELQIALYEHVFGICGHDTLLPDATRWAKIMDKTQGKETELPAPMQG
jgi:hypothetical protein